LKIPQNQKSDKKVSKLKILLKFSKSEIPQQEIDLPSNWND
jgi:hypothetical protein